MFHSIIILFHIMIYYMTLAIVFSILQVTLMHLKRGNIVLGCMPEYYVTKKGYQLEYEKRLHKWVGCSKWQFSATYFLNDPYAYVYK